MVKKNEEVKPQTGLLMADLKGIQVIKGHNPRQIDLKSQSFLDLVESVRAQGVIVPVHVRTPNGPAGLFELLAGERRCRAAQAAGLTTIPTINHGVISDEQAFEITFAENFAREDLTTLEQGRAVALLLERYKGDYTAVAGKLGKTESWVRMRHTIETNLIKEWKQAVDSNGSHKHFTAAHLELVARFPANIQEKILNDIRFDSDISVNELAKRLADMLRLIRKANFDTAKCIKCTKRSDAQPQLWTDPASQKVGTSDRCLDAACWSRKDLAACKQKLAELREKYPGLVSICTKSYLWGDEERKASSSYGKYLTAGDYETCKKTDPKAVPAVIVNGKGAGKIQYVKIKHPDSPRAQKTHCRTLKELRADLTEKRWMEAISRMCEQIGNIKFDDVMSKHGMRSIVWMAAIYGTGDGTFGKERLELLKQFEKDAADSAAVPLRFIWEQISGSMDCIADNIGAEQKEGLVLARLFGLDLDAEFKKVCEEYEFAEPAEWANLNADGTPKAAKTAKSEKKTKDDGRGTKDAVRKCRECGCTESNACLTENTACIDEETGEPCHWVEDDLCSACKDKAPKGNAGALARHVSAHQALIANLQGGPKAAKKAAKSAKAKNTKPSKATENTKKEAAA